MARVRMVTRTVEITTYNVKCYDCVTNTISDQNLELGVLPNNVDPLKALKKQYESDFFKIIVINGSETVTKLNGMPESKFIELAEILPDRQTNN